jgi:hypothetical protein
MHVQERQAWFILVVTVAALVVFAALVALLGFRQADFGAFGLLGAAGIAGLIGRRERKAGRVILDERDREIERVATVAGYSMFWLLFVAAALVPFFVLGPGAVMRVPTVAFPDAVFVAMSVVLLTRALATIILYRRGADGRHV